jgi:CheY-like chemotaxis protein
MGTAIRLLLVEDDPADARFALETLKEYNIQNELYVIHDGEQALDYLRQQAPHENATLPDMLLLDMRLPKKDGLEVLAEMRTVPALKDLPVVVLTSSPLDKDMMSSYGVPADCIIMKPLTIERYLEAIRCFPSIGLSLVKVAKAAT